MQVTYLSVPGSAEVENQDHVVAQDRMVCVLDGVTPPESGSTGCTHGVRWYVERLGHAVASRSRCRMSLAEQLAAAIDEVRLAHVDSCDLANPRTPSAAVAILRIGDSTADYLVLCDCAVILDQAGGVTVHTDATTRGPERARRTSSAGPLWKAGVVPDAAYSAVSGTVPLTGPAGLRRAAVMTDGVTRAVLTLGLLSWEGLLTDLNSVGPGRVISSIRAAEASHRYPDGRRPKKTHDDATAVACQMV